MRPSAAFAPDIPASQLGRVCGRRARRTDRVAQDAAGALAVRRRSARRCSRRSACCRGTASRARRWRCSTARAPRSPRALPAGHRHRRARAGQRREAGAAADAVCTAGGASDARTSWTCPPDALRRGRAHAGAPAARARRAAPGRVRGGTASGDLGASHRRTPGRLSRIEHRQLRSRRLPMRCWPPSPPRLRRRRPAARRGPGEAGACAP